MFVFDCFFERSHLEKTFIREYLKSWWGFERTNLTFYRIKTFKRFKQPLKMCLNLTKGENWEGWIRMNQQGYININSNFQPLLIASENHPFFKAQGKLNNSFTGFREYRKTLLLVPRLDQFSNSNSFELNQPVA